MQGLFNTVWGLIELLIFFVVVVAITALWSYNKLRAPSENVKEAWANVPIAARKKVAMVNQLSDVAKAYQDNEKLMILELSQDSSVAALQAANAQTGNIYWRPSMVWRGGSRILKRTRSTRTWPPRWRAERTTWIVIRNRYNAMAKRYNVPRTSVPHVFYDGLLGFRTAPYLTMDAVEGPDQTIQGRSFPTTASACSSS
jgi:hypothetical protein